MPLPALKAAKEEGSYEAAVGACPKIEAGTVAEQLADVEDDGRLNERTKEDGERETPARRQTRRDPHTPATKGQAPSFKRKEKQVVNRRRVTTLNSMLKSQAVTPQHSGT